MKLNSLSEYIFCELSLYQFDDNSAEMIDLFKGKMSEVPDDLLDREIECIHPQDGSIGICVERR